MAQEMAHASAEDALRQLEKDGLLRREQAIFRTTRRWQAAMARAAYRLFEIDGGSDDLRPAIAAALLEVYGHDAPSERIAELLEAMLPIELRELAPRRA